METRVFNAIFELTIDHFFIKIDELALDIDRHSSRIRHWKKDSLPSKYLIVPLTKALLKQIEKGAFTHKTEEFKKAVTQHLDMPMLDSQDLAFDVYFEQLFQYAYEQSLVKSPPSVKGREDRPSAVSRKLTDAIAIGKSYESSGNYELAEKHYLEVFSTIKSPHEKAVLKGLIGAIAFLYLQYYATDAYFEKAVENYEWAIAHIDGDLAPYEHAILLKQMGSIYTFYAMNRASDAYFEKALAYYQQALAAIEMTDNTLERLKITHNIALAYTFYRKPSEVYENSNRAIAIFNTILSDDSLEDVTFRAQCEMNLSIAYANQIEVRFSHAYFKRAVELSESALKVFTLEKSPFQYASLHLNLSTIYGVISQISEPVKNGHASMVSSEKVIWVYENDLNHRNYRLAICNLCSIKCLLYDVTGDVNYLHSAKDQLVAVQNIIDKNPDDMVYVYALLALCNYNAACYKAGIDQSAEAMLATYDPLIQHKGPGLSDSMLGTAYLGKCKSLLKVYKKQKDLEVLDRALIYHDTLFSLFTALNIPVYYGLSNITFGEIYLAYFEHTGDVQYKAKAKVHFDKALMIFNPEDYSEKYNYVQEKLGELN